MISLGAKRQSGTAMMVQYLLHAHSHSQGVDRFLDAQATYSTPETFIRQARAVRRRFGKRRDVAQGYHNIVSFGPDEMNWRDPDDVERAMDVARAIGREEDRRLGEPHMRLYVAQADNDNHVLHVHEYVVATGLLTGRQIDTTLYRHENFVELTNAAAASVGYDNPTRYPGRGRGDSMPIGELKSRQRSASWKQTVEAQVLEVLDDPRLTADNVREDIVEVARDHGVDVELTDRSTAHSPNRAPGISYRVRTLDENGEEVLSAPMRGTALRGPGGRGRLTVPGLEKIMRERERERQEQQQRAQQAATPEPEPPAEPAWASAEANEDVLVEPPVPLLEDDEEEDADELTRTLDAMRDEEDLRREDEATTSAVHRSARPADDKDDLLRDIMGDVDAQFASRPAPEPEPVETDAQRAERYERRHRQEQQAKAEREQRRQDIRDRLGRITCEGEPPEEGEELAWWIQAAQEQGVHVTQARVKGKGHALRFRRVEDVGDAEVKDTLAQDLGDGFKAREVEDRVSRDWQRELEERRARRADAMGPGLADALDDLEDGTVRSSVGSDQGFGPWSEACGRHGIQARQRTVLGRDGAEQSVWEYREAGAADEAEWLGEKDFEGLRRERQWVQRRNDRAQRVRKRAAQTERYRRQKAVNVVLRELDRDENTIMRFAKMAVMVAVVLEEEREAKERAETPIKLRHADVGVSSRDWQRGLE